MAKSAFQQMKQMAALKRFALWLLFSAACGLYAQNSVSEQGIFSPFVSQLTVETRNNLVRLSWIDSRDVWGPVYIFRSFRPIESGSLAGMRPVEIPYGTQYYVDETENGTAYFYFVAASDVNGQRFDIVIPFTNTASAASQVNLIQESPVTTIPGQTSSNTGQTPDISNLTAYADGDRVIITFSITGYIRNTVLYRNTQPISRVQDLLSAVIVQSGNGSPVIDYPAPGFSYYYALIFNEDISNGSVVVRPGRNATVYPVEVAERSPAIPPEIRGIPLPSMSGINTVPEDSYVQLPNPAPHEAPAVNARGPALPQKQPRVFANDLEVPAGGEESILRTIIQGPFTRREWNTVRDQVIQYLSLPRSAITEARARFYLGQAYYFNGQNRESLLEFLFVRDRFPTEAAEWIETILSSIGN
jgi:hypothetical protein